MIFLPFSSIFFHFLCLPLRTKEEIINNRATTDLWGSTSLTETNIWLMDCRSQGEPQVWFALKERRDNRYDWLEGWGIYALSPNRTYKYCRLKQIYDLSNTRWRSTGVVPLLRKQAFVLRRPSFSVGLRSP